MYEYEKLVLSAITKGEFIECLQGKGAYCIEMSSMMSVDIPTDWTMLMNQGLYPVFQKYPELHLHQKFQTALIQMLDGDAFSIFVTISLLYQQWYNEAHAVSPFVIDKTVILPKMHHILASKKAIIEKYHGWSAFHFTDGLWGLVIRKDNMCRTQWGFSILADFSERGGIMDYVIQDRNLIVYGKPVTFSAPVWNAQRFADNIIAITKPSIGHPDYTHALYAVAESGELLWQMEDTSRFFNKGEEPRSIFNFSITKARIIAYDFYSKRYTVDLKNGKIIDMIERSWYPKSK